MLTGANQQIITAYEEEGMSPADISEAFSYDIVAVKATLMSFSSKYRQDIKEEPSLDYSLDEQEEAKRTIVSLMRSTDDEYLKARLAMKIRDDGKGRLDMAKVSNGLNINVNLFNVQLQKMRDSLNRSKQLAQTPPPNVTIDIPEKKEIAA